MLLNKRITIEYIFNDYCVWENHGMFSNHSMLINRNIAINRNILKDCNIALNHEILKNHEIFKTHKILKNHKILTNNRMQTINNILTNRRLARNQKILKNQIRTVNQTNYCLFDINNTKVRAKQMKNPLKFRMEYKDNVNEEFGLSNEDSNDEIFQMNSISETLKNISRDIPEKNNFLDEEKNLKFNIEDDNIEKCNVKGNLSDLLSVEKSIDDICVDHISVENNIYSSAQNNININIHSSAQNNVVTLTKISETDQSINTLEIDSSENNNSIISEKALTPPKIIFSRKFIESVNNEEKIFYSNKRVALYKTEMCRSFSEVGYCKYGERCQFSHSPIELRGVSRHPKYKTETCRVFWEQGTCPYGRRCCFVHYTNNNLKKKNPESIKFSNISKKKSKFELIFQNDNSEKNKYDEIEMNSIQNSNEKLNVKLNVNVKPNLNVKPAINAIGTEIKNEAFYPESHPLTCHYKGIWTRNKARIWNDKPTSFIRDHINYVNDIEK